MKPFILAVVVTLALPALAAAQDSINGGWSGTVQGAEGEPTLGLVLTVKDGILTGSVIEPEGVEFSISDGLFADAQLQFKATRPVADTQVVIHWIGSVSGNEIILTRAEEDSQNPPVSFVVRKS